MNTIRHKEQTYKHEKRLDVTPGLLLSEIPKVNRHLINVDVCNIRKDKDLKVT